MKLLQKKNRSPSVIKILKKIPYNLVFLMWCKFLKFN